MKWGCGSNIISREEVIVLILYHVSLVLVWCNKMYDVVFLVLLISYYEEVQYH